MSMYIMHFAASKLPPVQAQGEFGLANKDRFDPEYAAVVKALVAERKRRGLTQVDVADRMGTTQSLISRYERLDVLLDVLDFVRYCVALRCEPGAFLSQFNWLKSVKDESMHQ